MKQCLVIKHVDFANLGNLEPVLVENDFSIKYLQAGRDNINIMNQDEIDLLVILSGPISACDEAIYSWLNDEIELIKNRILSKKPIIGIGLGAQLIAKACGAKVYPGGKKEIGWKPLQLTSAAYKHSVNTLLNATLFHWHGDTFDLPTDAILLASTDIYQHQAFSIGNHCLALQFHPEMTKEALELWFIARAGEIEYIPWLNIISMREQANQYSDKLKIVAKTFWTNAISEMGLIKCNVKMYKQIVIDRNYKVYRDSKSKRLIMSVDGKPTLSANYYYDKPGRCVLISKFEFFDNNHAKLDLFALLDILHKYIATNRYAKKAGCRFMCMVNKEFSNVLLAFEFHSKQAPYLMVRTNKSQPIGDNPRIDTDNIVVINNKTDLINLKTTLTKILSGNAYWLNNADENEVVHRIKKAEHAFAIALKGQDETNVIGFVRVIDDGLLQYISDVVIAGEFQNKGYGKYLFKIINDKVLSESKIGLLVRAHEGPGLLPAKMVYEKFGFFESNDTNQQIGNEVIGYKVVHNSTQHPQRLKP